MHDSEDESSQALHELHLKYIPWAEFQDEDHLGTGVYGVVKKARWLCNHSSVALKYLDFDEFCNEAKQLSKICHENIIGLYGYSWLDKRQYILVLEYADGGDLYSVLHNREHQSTSYTLSHAISWCLQCARGVKYLHSIQPKPIIHRDLKPLNLLLNNCGRSLKICDFGTARVKQTIMSTNKGSPLWMAPEVFSSNKYTEKCDVFSWGIIFWEVLTRRVPYENYRESTAVLWAICNRKRPPPIRNCPSKLKDLMQSCWDPDPPSRPSMAQVVDIMETVFTHCSSHADDPIDLSTHDYPDQRRAISNIASHNTYLTHDLSSLASPSVTYSARRTSDDSNIRHMTRPSSAGHKRSNSSDASLLLGSPDDDELVESLIQDFNAYSLLAKKFHPVQPDIHDSESYSIFDEHRKLSIKLLRLRYEYDALCNHFNELKKMSTSTLREGDCLLYMNLEKENNELRQTRNSFADRVRELKSPRKSRADEDWVIVDSPDNRPVASRPSLPSQSTSPHPHH